MGSRYVWNKFGIVSFVRTLMRDHYLGVLIALYFIILAAFGGIFYVWAVQFPFNSTGWVESVIDEAEVVQPYTELEKMSDEIAVGSATPPVSGSQSQNSASNEMTVETSTGTGAPQVHINGESVVLPKNGNVHQVIQSGDGTAHLDISVTSGSDNNSTSSSSLKLNIESSSMTTKEAD